VVINGRTIYTLTRNKAIVIDMPTNPTRMVITDGYHITKPMDLVYTVRPVRYFTVACAVEDAQLLFGFLMTAALYGMGFTSGFIVLQLLSLVPIFYLLFIYYINRKEFIKIKQL
jgi:hypothetical protein